MNPKLISFLGGLVAGPLGLKVLASKEAKTVYAHVTAAALCAGESASRCMTQIREETDDILADAKQINAEKKDQAAEVIADVKA